MTDQENNIVGCVTSSPNDKYCPFIPVIPWRFVTATADGEPHFWRTMGADAQTGDLAVMFDGPRIFNDRRSYDPMRKQGAILLGNGGDNSNSSQGTFYEGAMTAAGTYPTKETNQKIQDNIEAAKYDVQRLSLTPANAIDTPPGLQTFSLKSTQNSTVTFTNTTGAPVKDVTLSIIAPKGWKSVVLNSKEISKKFTDPIAQGASVSASFAVTSGSESFNGDLIGKATWAGPTAGQMLSETTIEKVRNVNPIKINEFRISAGASDNSTNSFIELYNPSSSEIDISNWTLTNRPILLPIFSSMKIPAGTKLAAKGFYLFGLANSGLSVPAKKGESTIYVRSTTGMTVGDEIEIDNGSTREVRKIASLGTAAAYVAPVTQTQNQFGGGGGGRQGDIGPTTIWQPLPDGPVITIPVGSTSVPVASVAGFEVGQKMAIGYGATYPVAINTIEKYEVVTVTKVGKPGTVNYLSADAKVGQTNIKVASTVNVSVGDKIRLDIDSKGHGIEWVTVKSVGTQSVRNTFNGPLKPEDQGTGLDLAEPIKFNHSYNIPFSVRGTGISFEPATAFAHSSNEPVLALGISITLDSPLTRDHTIEAVVRDQKVTTAGYQGTPVPNQWFGGPALSSAAGNILLRDATGNVVDGLNYGGLVDPWAAEGYQANSGGFGSGCFVPSPGARGGQRGVPVTSTSQPDRSAGRYPDGADTDFNCRDFMLQNTVNLLTATTAGSNNIKVGNVRDFSVGQKIIIETGANSETAVINAIGTTGGTTVGTATTAGATVIPVASVEGFSAGQTITIDNGANGETAVVASITQAQRGPGGGGGARPTQSATITVTGALTKAHAVGSQVSGSGITLSSALTKAHEIGVVITSNLPTPGAPNQFSKKL